MNFLAHIFLSGGHDKIMVGNFIGDFVKGKSAMEKFETEIIRGIELHRAIDEFTDKHPIVSESKNRLRPKYRHYSGVIVDVFYDHFLAKNWKDYHPVPLPDFAAQAYNTLRSFDKILPEDVKYMLPYMVKGNWLLNYSKIEGIHQALSGMSRRTKFQSKMEEASEELYLHFDEFQKEFNQFFPELRKVCERKIEEWQ